MSGSCKKADRNRKSNSAAAYKNGRRWEVNKTKRAKREAKRAERFAKKMIERAARNKPKRGDARRKARAHLQRAA